MILTPMARVAARRLFISLALTAAAITANHTYAFGPFAYLLGLGLVIVSAALWWRLVATARLRFLTGYLLVSLWVIVGFGLVKGFWESTLKVFLAPVLAAMSSAFPTPTFGPPGLEISGVAIWIGSLFVLSEAYRLVQATLGARTPSPWRAAAATAALFAAIAGAFAINSRDTWSEPPNGIVKIGIIAPTSGHYALLGQSFVAAARMAASDLTGTRYRYELIVRDSGPDPAQATGVIQSVVSDDNVQAIVGGISLIGQVTQRVAAEARIAHVCICTVLSIGDGAYSFTNIPTPRAEAVRWVEEAKRRGIRRVALLSQDYPSINNHVAALKAEAASAGLRVTSEQTFAGTTTHFAALIAAAESSRPDVIYVEALNPALDRLGQQLSEANVRHIASVVSPSLSEKPELFEGAWYTDSNLRDHGFKVRFENEHPQMRFATHMMPYAYDSVRMIAAAFERGENPAVYLRGLTTYEGTAGTLTKAGGRGNFTSAPAVWTITNGRAVLRGQ